jgi:dihydrofolate reductase
MSRIAGWLRLTRKVPSKGSAGYQKEIEMRRVIANEFMTLDGVVQAPSYSDEDNTGGFDHGGWHTRYLDDLSMRWMIENISGAGGFLLGRGTYEMFAAHWPNASEGEQVLAEPLNMRPKYVASTTLAEPLDWQNSTLLRGDVGEAVRALKAEEGNDLHAIGSPELVQTLIERDLVDELQLMIDPVIVGGGKHLFREDGNVRQLQLVSSRVATTGAIIATYARPPAARLLDFESTLPKAVEDLVRARQG